MRHCEAQGNIRRVFNGITNLAFRCFFFHAAPVSYTHLDVYKRQVHDQIQCLLGGYIGSDLVSRYSLLDLLRFHTILLGQLVAVSYTHLFRLAGLFDDGL